MQETVQIPLHPARQCICCDRREKKYKLKSFPSHRIPEFYSNHDILIPQKKSKICTICLKNLENDIDIRIPAKTVNIDELDSNVVSRVLKLMSRWKKRIKYQTMSDKNFQEVGISRKGWIAGQERKFIHFRI